MMKRFFRVLAAAALLAAVPSMAQPLAVQGEPALAPKVEAVAKLRIEAASAAAPRLRAQAELAPVAEIELEAVREANRRAVNVKRLVIGVNRAADFAAQLPAASDLRWVEVDGGRAAQAAVTSPQAAALRLAIELAGVPTDVEMVFFGSGAPQRLIGPIRVGDIADRSAAWWSPLTEGDTQTVEFFVPGARDAGALPLRIVNASHLFADPASKFQKRVQDIGSAGTCEVDIPCSSLLGNPGFRNAAESVAQMVFTDGSFTALCTGTLLNDSDPATQVPWFYSANHCFENENPPYKTPAQMQVVANSLNTLWHFEAVTCRSVAVPNYSQLSGGATLLYNSPQLDALFLRLNNAPPAGAFFSGWDATTPAPSLAVLTIHHPEGDLKKVSEGSVLDLAPPSGGVGGASIAFVRTGWVAAVTEPGSSGAGLFSYDGTQYALRGGLWGGPSSCTALPSNLYDYFSRFDLVYPALAQYLGAASTAIDYTDLWWNPAESGWGLNLIQHASRNIFGVWYTYAQDRKPAWYVMPGGTWTASNVFRGDLYVTSGPPQTTTFDPNRVVRTLVGSATLTFGDANNGTFAYSINGISGTKAITRQPF